ncbi:MAG: PEP-utilizing enzyme [Patescibacteria group bacterium]|jgi:phosphoenolpyruvate synthase/pyruvate phosphate dikinase
MSSAVQRYGDWRIKPSGKLPIFLRFIINSGFSHKISAAIGFKHHMVNRTYLHHMMYWPAKEYDAFEKEIIDYVKYKKNWLEHFYRKEFVKYNDLYRRGLQLKKIDWAKKSNQEISEVLDTQLNKYRYVTCSWYTQYPLDEYFETTIEIELVKYLPADHPDFRKIVLIFTDPRQMTDVANEKWKLMKIAKEFKKKRENLSKPSPQAKKIIERHLDAYAYINRGLATSKAYTFSNIIARIRQAWSDKKGLNELIHLSSPQKIKEEYQWALNKVKPKPNFRRIITQARYHSYVRNRRVEAFFLSDYGASFMYNEIARRAHFNKNWIMDISVPEMFSALKGKPLPSKAEMQRRFKDYAMIVRDAKTELIVDARRIKALEKKFFVKIADVKEIQGRMACLGGLIKGTAKVCLDKHEIGKVKKGDILVTQFTTPDFVPAMERAAAIVADQGGLSSHAAIVSRELGVPCVISTEYATRVIKDGDWLEVNARTGLVKISKRK